ncbi:MAG: DUF1015 domain-containing protein [Acidobacteria bacterium]|nr:DUF1015 domain-containing protein [Acidobacteriota bacterium]
MPRFEPFRGVRYAPGVDLDAATSPPYDVIDRAERAALVARHPANAVRFDLPDEADGPGRYDAAAAMLDGLQAEGVLVTDPAPSFYGYRMTYTDEAGTTRHTTGVLGALALSRPGEGDILPHEHTTPKAKSDRLDLLQATGFNLSPIWGLSLATGLAEAITTAGAPDAACTDADGVRHELWCLTEPDRVATISALVASTPIVVADGHHRYETSLAYREERRAVDGEGGPWDATLALVVELREDELAVRPIHRLLHGLPADLDVAAALSAHFECALVDPSDNLPATMAAAGALGLVVPDGRAWLLAPRAGAFPAELPDLDSARLAAALPDLPAHDVEYQHGADTVLARVRAGEASAGVLLRPAGVPQIAATAHGGERMPPKTTFFWPKPRTGFVFRSVR